MIFFNFIGRGIENFTLGHGGGLVFSQKVLKSLPGPLRQLFMTTLLSEENDGFSI